MKEIINLIETLEKKISVIEQKLNEYGYQQNVPELTKKLSHIESTKEPFIHIKTGLLQSLSDFIETEAAYHPSLEKFAERCKEYALNAVSDTTVVSSMLLKVIFSVLKSKVAPEFSHAGAECPHCAGSGINEDLESCLFCGSSGKVDEDVLEAYNIEMSRPILKEEIKKWSKSHPLNEAYSIPKRYNKTGVGKKMGDELYVHKSSINTLPENVKQKISQTETPFDWEIIKYNMKTGVISLIECNDWNTVDEPTTGRSFLIKPDGTTKITNPPADPWIYHHKWTMVGDDYQGFDVEGSKARSEKWSKLDNIDSTRIGKKSYWEQNYLPRINEDDEELSAEPGSEETPVATTTGSYKKAIQKIIEINPEAASVLDYGAGMGYGSDAMRVIFKNPDAVHSYEPAPQKWLKTRQDKPHFTKNTDIKGKYDGIVNLNVLNVVTPPLRDKIVKDIASKLTPGGIAIIGTRGWNGDISSVKNSEPGQEEKSLWVIKNGKKSYQKGFDGNELVQYVKTLLPDCVVSRWGNGPCSNCVIVIKQ